ncbi:MAG: sigma-54-dependent Fis family transcriptional regulator [Pelagibacterales bacterium]|nr:sigma-54-dependent Fis family transcriptional regulator [Pelagibacterales bacterium]RCL82125.1 MAG: sigma-54-dependent Fis family transcriptional regulator [Alphaproteobacteria bacterium]|tara:strand:+ start:995 stop:2383 length:1389 start_codon:yes stop_codon:yes gene_type:complete
MLNNILVVDDEEDIRKSIAGLLEDENYQVRTVENSDQALDAISERVPDLILLDIWLENSKLDGMELLKEIQSKFLFVPCIMISGHGNIDIAVKAIRSGASDYIEKPFEAERLLITLERVLELSKLKKEHKELWLRAGGELELIGESILIKKIHALIKKVSPTGSRILITGEYGTGKETLARLIHLNSKRSLGPFIVLNSQILSNDELEELLFGEEDSDGRIIRIGLLEQANNGTLFIDEVASLTSEAQAFFIKALQGNSYKRKNGTSLINVDVRVISSSSIEIHNKILDKTFSEDLYYRLNVVPIEMPSLSKRKEDIPLLINYFLNKACETSGRSKISLDNQALASLQAINWSGNVRQLKNTIERILIMIDDNDLNIISYDMLPKDLINIEKLEQKNDNNVDIEYLYSLKLKEARNIFEHDYILKNLDRFNGNVSKTANFIGMERSAFHRKLNTLKKFTKKN